MELNHEYKPFRFFLITFLITWISWFVAAWFSYQPGMQGPELLSMIPGLPAPFIAVLVMIGGVNNKGSSVFGGKVPEFGGVRAATPPAHPQIRCSSR